MRSKKIGGLICPIATPINADENLDVKGLQKLLDIVMPWMDGIFPLGSSGQFTLISDAVADQVVDVTVQHVQGRVPIYVGVSDSSTAAVIRKAERLRHMAVDYVVVSTTFYYAFQHQQALVDHFTRIADLSPKPVILYNIPQNTGMPLTAASAAILANHPNIVGIKDSWGDMFLFQELLALRSDKFIVMQGREQLAAASLWLGADGIVSALPNFAPQILRDLDHCVKAGDRLNSLSIQRKITRLAAIFDQTYWLSALMAALAELGIGSGRAGRPLPECTPEQRTFIRQRMQEANLL
jgi:dihydrodipicolinate synthase/N-acetylneuraminate lyase